MGLHKGVFGIYMLNAGYNLNHKSIVRKTERGILDEHGFLK